MIKTVKTWMLAGAVLSSAMAAGHALGQGVELINFPSWFRPISVSTEGSVVVGHRTSPVEPYLWTRDGGLVRLRGPNGEAWSGKAFSCSADGSVVVGTTIFGGEQRPFRWTAATGIVPIMEVTRGNGYDISDDGSILVGNARQEVTAAGFFMDAAFVTRDLIAPGDTTSAMVKCVSHDGRYAVGNSQSGGSGSFVRWDLIEGTAEVLLLETSTGLPLRGFAMDCNADGSIVVGRANVNSPGQESRPVMWTTNGLQFLADAGSVVNAVNADGLVIGGTNGGFSNRASWISTLGIPPMPFESFLQTYYDFTPPRNLHDLISISADGRTIVGGGNPSAGWLVRLPGSRQADFNRDRAVDFFDLADFVDCFEGRHLLPVSSADLNRDGFTDFFDFIQFVEDFER